MKTHQFKADVSFEISTRTFAIFDRESNRRYEETHFEIQFSTSKATRLFLGTEAERAAWPEGIESIRVSLTFFEDDSHYKPLKTTKAAWTPADGDSIALDLLVSDKQIRDIMHWLYLYEGDFGEGCPFDMNIELVAKK